MTYHKLNQSKRFISIDNTVNSSDSDDGLATTLKDFLQNESDEEYSESLSESIDMKAELMKSGIKKLDKKFRKVIEMRELEGLQYKDIAARLKRNESTVKRQIRNGRLKLIDMTKQEFKKIDDTFN